MEDIHVTEEEEEELFRECEGKTDRETQTYREGVHVNMQVADMERRSTYDMTHVNCLLRPPVACLLVFMPHGVLSLIKPEIPV